jgi:hypothetical protein
VWKGCERRVGYRVCLYDLRDAGGAPLFFSNGNGHDEHRQNMKRLQPARNVD